jgi:hypothetical protein
MTIQRRIAAIASGLLLGSVLVAQEAEPTTLGLQLRGSYPESGLRDSVGGGDVPGVGFSLVMEEDLAQWFEGWHARMDLGGDFWFWGNLTSMPGTSGKVTAGHVTGELVRMLRPGTGKVTLGPYLTMGVGVYEWNRSLDTPTGKVDTHVGHGVGTLGFGMRLTPSFDLEAKVLMGKLDPDTTALAIMACGTYRF